MERHNGLNHSMSADHRGQSVNTSIKGPWKRRAYISAFALAVFTPSPACIMANNSAILNPTTPLAYLPPAFADQLQVSCYVAVAGLSVSTQFKSRRGSPSTLHACFFRRLFGTGLCPCQTSAKYFVEVNSAYLSSLILCHGL